MIVEYIGYRLITLFAGVIQLLADLVEYINNDFIFKEDSIFAIRVTNLFDSIGSPFSIVFREIQILLSLFIAVLLISLMTSARKPMLFRRVLYTFGTCMLILGTIGLISKVCWAIDFYKFPYYYNKSSAPFGTSRGVIVAIVKSVIWIVVGFTLKRSFRLPKENNGENTALPVNNPISENTEQPQKEKNTEIPLQTHPAIRFCRFCGKELEPGANFCRHCGARMDDQT